MSLRQPHAAFGLPTKDLDIIVVDDSKATLMIIRSILLAMKVARVRTFESAPAAMDAIMTDPANMLIVDWMMSPIDGIVLTQAIRKHKEASVATLPAIMLTSSPTQELVERALKIGIHAVLAKPIAPADLQKRIQSILQDRRQFIKDETSGLWQLDGAIDLLIAQRKRQSQYRHARNQYIAVAQQKAQKVVDKIAHEAAAPAKSESFSSAPIQVARVVEKATVRGRPAGFGARRSGQESTT